MRHRAKFQAMARRTSLSDMIAWMEIHDQAGKPAEHDRVAWQREFKQLLALINALVLSNVLLVAEDMMFASRFKNAPLLYPIVRPNERNEASLTASSRAKRSNPGVLVWIASSP